MSQRESTPSHAAILARMAATRAELIAANHVSSMVSDARRGSLPSTAKEGPLILQSPYAGLIAASLVVSVILGPMHLVRLAARRGLAPWIAYTARSLLRR
jgi:hypothetical protein